MWPPLRSARRKRKTGSRLGCDFYAERDRASAVAFEESEGGGEEASGGEGEEDDGAAVGSLGCGWGGGGVVQALRAALGVDWWRAQG